MTKNAAVRRRPGSSSPYETTELNAESGNLSSGSKSKSGDGRKLLLIVCFISFGLTVVSLRTSTSEKVVPKDAPILDEIIQPQQQKQEEVVEDDDSMTDQALRDILRDLEPPFAAALSNFLPAITARPGGSEVVELRHCRLGQLDYDNFTDWAAPILKETKDKFQGLVERRSPDIGDLTMDTYEKQMQPEFILQLLEMYASHHPDGDKCNFGKYSLQIAGSDFSQQTATLQAVPPSKDSSIRFAFVIVAFRDARHLARIVAAIHMPQHYIVIHLEQQTPLEYEAEVREFIAENKYTNVVVCKFSTVTYRTDSISLINLQLMHWLAVTVGLEYDYHFTLGGAVYPLYSANELLEHMTPMKQKQRHVWLGELVHNGKILDGDTYLQWDYLQRKRLIFTAGNTTKWQTRTKKILHNGFTPTIPEFIQTNMTKKTNSGNQAVFSYKFVQDLVTSPQIKQLFALAKYGCCCCLEERTWITAARILGYGEEAMASAGMFQVWGGKTTCQSSMNNAVLGMNHSICFKNEDAGLLRSAGYKDGEPIYVWGSEILKELQKAKRERGYMFARKFKSSDEGSMELLERIRKEIHHP